MPLGIDFAARGHVQQSELFLRARTCRRVLSTFEETSWPPRDLPFLLCKRKVVPGFSIRRIGRERLPIPFDRLIDMSGHQRLIRPAGRGTRDVLLLFLLLPCFEAASSCGAFSVSFSRLRTLASWNCAS